MELLEWETASFGSGTKQSPWGREFLRKKEQRGLPRRGRGVLKARRKLSTARCWRIGQWDGGGCQARWCDTKGGHLM